MPKDSQVAVSLIVPTFRREDLLVQTLRCALSQDRSDYEILVIDQTPEHCPATKEFFQNHSKQIKLIRQTNPSVTQARNTGIRVARGAILVFVDDDTTFGADFLSQHVKQHRDGVGGVQGRIVESGAAESSTPIWISRWIRFRGSDNCVHDGVTNNFTGCNFSLHRSAVEHVGFFDERYSGVAVREETDYALRLTKTGFVIRFAAAAKVFHHRSETGGHGAGGNILFFNPLYYFNEFLFAKKHFSPFAVWIYRIRLKLRGKRAIHRLIRVAEADADSELRQQDPEQ